MFFLAGWLGDALALLAGALMPLAFAPHDYFPLAIVSLALLFASWLAATAGRAFWRGFLFGLAMFGFGVHWVYISIHGYGGVAVPLALFLSALLVMYMALFPALLGYLLVRFVPGLGARSAVSKLLLVFPAAWCLSELLRGWLFTGFPWLSLGYSQIDSPLSGIAPLLGVYGVSWAAALAAALLLSLLLQRAWRARFASALALLALFGAAQALSTLDWTRPAGEMVRVSLVQGNIPQELKWDDSVYQSTFDLYRRLTRAHKDSDLVVWPETAVPDFYHVAKGELGEIWREARQHHTDLLVGVLYLDQDSRHYYNALLGLSEQESFYFKSHLVPFTEYLPLRALFGDLVDFMQVPMSNFSAGRIDQAPLSLAGNPIGMSICYEDVFGEELVRVVPQATMLANVSNDGWFGDSGAAWQHLQIARMRALEAGRPLLRATNTGVSSIMDHRGDVMAMSELNITDVVSAEVEPRAGLTPYVRFRNTPVLVLVLVATVGGVVWVARGRRR